MPEFELTRSRDDRRIFGMAGVGTLRFEGWFNRRAIATSAHGSWTFRRSGVFRTTIEATDTTGTPVGDFTARAIRRGGSLRWLGTEYEVRAASMWKERYALAAGDVELLVLDAASWGKRPVTGTTLEPELVTPELVLFTAFVAKHLAEDSAAAAGGAASAAATAG